jgi:hypothetical protein
MLWPEAKYGNLDLLVFFCTAFLERTFQGQTALNGIEQLNVDDISSIAVPGTLLLVVFGNQERNCSENVGGIWASVDTIKHSTLGLSFLNAPEAMNH